MSLLLRCLMEVRAKAGEVDLLTFPAASAHVPTAPDSPRVQRRFGGLYAADSSGAPSASLLGRSDLQEQRVTGFAPAHG